METTTLPIFELGVLLLVAALAGWLARRLRLPAIVGYLAVGVLVSPFTPGYVADHEQLQLLADVGVVLLLFEVGIEVDVARLRREHGQLLWAAPLQTVITAAIATAAATLAGLPPFGAGAVGLGVAMSSSVVIVNITRSRRRTTTPETERGAPRLERPPGHHRRRARGRPPRGLRRPRPAAGSRRSPGSSAFARPRGRRGPGPRRASLRRLRPEHDLFLIVSVATGLALAGAGAVIAGIPLALAAFVAGLAVAESPESAEARRRLLPFRDVFAVLFFVAIGTLIDPDAFGRGLGWLALIVGARRRGEGARRVPAGPGRAAPRRAGPDRHRPGPDGRVQLRARVGRGTRPARSGRRSTPRSWARSSSTIIGSTVLVRLVGLGGPRPNGELSAAPAA